MVHGMTQLVIRVCVFCLTNMSQQQGPSHHEPIEIMMDDDNQEEEQTTTQHTDSLLPCYKTSSETDALPSLQCNNKWWWYRSFPTIRHIGLWMVKRKYIILQTILCLMSILFLVMLIVPILYLFIALILDARSVHPFLIVHPSATSIADAEFMCKYVGNLRSPHPLVENRLISREQVSLILPHRDNHTVVGDDNGSQPNGENKNETMIMDWTHGVPFAVRSNYVCLVQYDQKAGERQQQMAKDCTKTNNKESAHLAETFVSDDPAGYTIHCYDVHVFIAQHLSNHTGSASFYAMCIGHLPDYADATTRHYRYARP